MLVKEKLKQRAERDEAGEDDDGGETRKERRRSFIERDLDRKEMLQNAGTDQNQFILFINLY